MASLIEQFDEPVLEWEPIIPNWETRTNKIKPKISKKNVDLEMESEIESKREDLCILQVLGTLENYTGLKDKTLGDIKKLKRADVLKYHNRYQISMGKQVTDGLITTALETCSEMLSYVIPIDNTKELSTDLKNNELVKRELSNVAGWAVLKGGQFVALGSALIQIIKHIQFKKPDNEIEWEPQSQNTVE